MFDYNGKFSEDLINLVNEKEKALKPVFENIDRIAEENQYKVLQAFQLARVAEADFNQGSGYGYNETGRETLEKVYSLVFHTEDALVRPQITCGTHAIYLGLSANLLPGDELLYITGRPYDSLEMSIGLKESPMSLAEFGISFDYADLNENEDGFDFDAIRAKINSKTKIVAIQRSKGYKVRASISCTQIEEAVKFVKSVKPDVIVFVDNCYGEFAETTEPTDAGADLCVGSLIKNPGGGLAPIGGYIVGRKDLIQRCAYKLTAPGLGKEVGPSLGVLKAFFQGLSLAPHIVAQALKTAHLLAAVFEHYGYNTCPASDEIHHCIVQTIDLGSPQKVLSFCKAIQGASFVDSYVVPEDWDMPGYSDRVVMASGAFMNGSSIELSADGPMREPYTVFFQGGLTYEHGKYAVLCAAKDTES